MVSIGHVFLKYVLIRDIFTINWYILYAQLLTLISGIRYTVSNGNYWKQRTLALYKMLIGRDGTWQHDTRKSKNILWIRFIRENGRKEVELCEQFGVSRSTVRTAMLRLVQEGHLKRVKRKGTFVTAPRVLEDTTVFIESFFNEMFRRGIEVETEVLEFRYMEATEDLMEKFGDNCQKVIKLSRLRYAKDSFDKGPIVLTTSYLPEGDSFLFDYDFTKASLTTALKEHQKNRYSMEKEMTALVLGGRESHLMGMKEGSLAMLITSITKNDKGQVIDVTESIYPLERNKFVWKLKL